MLPARLDGRGYGDRSAHPPIGPVYRHHPSPCGSRVSALRTHYAPIIDTRAQQVCRCVHVRRQPSRGYGNLPRCHSYTATVHPSPLWAGRRSSARCPSRPCQCRTLCRPINAWRRYLAHRRAQCVPTTVAYDDPSHHVPSNASCELDGPCEGGHRHCVHQPPLCPPDRRRHAKEGLWGWRVTYTIKGALPFILHPPSRPFRGGCNSLSSGVVPCFVGCRPVLYGVVGERLGAAVEADSTGRETHPHGRSW